MTDRWDRHAILAEIKRRHGSLAAFAALVGMSASELSVALGRPFPKGDRAIARGLGIKQQKLFPDRYDAKGRRLRQMPPSPAAGDDNGGGKNEAQHDE
jgi:Ner family transcriptional regulator